MSETQWLEVQSAHPPPSSLIGYTLPGNTALGAFAGVNDGPTNHNVWVGDRAGTTNTTGSENVGVGDSALANCTTGGSNVGVGPGALFELTTGGVNTAVGYGGLEGLTTGILNTAVGYQAGQNITTGAANLCIGISTDVPDGTADNQLNIGGEITGIIGTQVSFAHRISIPNGCSLRFNGDGDANWRMGTNLGGYTTSLVGADTLGIVVGSGDVQPDGFSVGQTGGQSIMELDGNTRAALFTGSLSVGTPS